MIDEKKRGKIVNIGSQKFDELLDEGNSYVIDVREGAIYSRGHILGAINIPIDYFEKNVKNLPKNKKIVIYCDMGSSSIFCCRILAIKGYVVYNLVNGLYNYKGRYLRTK